MEQKILICEPSPEGIFSAVYYAYEKKLNPNITKIKLEEIDNYELFAEYIQVKTDLEKAHKVDRTIVKRFDNISYSYIWYALYSHMQEKGDAVYHTIPIYNLHPIFSSSI